MKKGEKPAAQVCGLNKNKSQRADKLELNTKKKKNT